MRVYRVLRVIIVLNMIMCMSSHSQDIKKQVKILVIDGGGVKGIVAAKILSKIEEMSDNQSIAENFDIITGTSVGGITSLLLNVPEDTPRCREIIRRRNAIVDQYNHMRRILCSDNLLNEVTQCTNKYTAQEITNMHLRVKDEDKFGHNLIQLLRAKCKAKYSAREIFDLYNNNVKKIFQRSILRVVKTGNGWLDSKYSSDALNELVKSKFITDDKEYKMSDSISHLLIPAYDFTANKTEFFLLNKFINILLMIR